MAGEFRVDIHGIKTIPIDEFGGKAYNVKQAIFEINPSIFTGTKPTTEAEMGDLITDFNSKRSIYKLGGLSSKGSYDTAYTALLDCMLSFAPYLNGIANGKEDVFKLSMLPYWDGTNDTPTLIKNGALATGLSYTPGATGIAKVSCAPFGRETKYICFAVQGGQFPAGTIMSLDGQIIIPLGEESPTCVININGKRSKTLVGLIPKTDYYLYYVMLCAGTFSGLSLPLKIAAGN